MRSAKALERAGHLSDDRFDFSGDAFEFRKVGPGDFDADRRFDAGGEHVDARFDRHRPGVVQAGKLHGGVHGVRSVHPACAGDAR